MTDNKKQYDLPLRFTFREIRPEEAEEDFVRKMYLYAADHLYQNLSWNKRLVFRYMKAF